MSIFDNFDLFGDLIPSAWLRNDQVSVGQSDGLKASRRTEATPSGLLLAMVNKGIALAKGGAAGLALATVATSYGGTVGMSSGLWDARTWSNAKVTMASHAALTESDVRVTIESSQGLFQGIENLGRSHFVVGSLFDKTYSVLNASSSKASVYSIFGAHLDKGVDPHESIRWLFDASPKEAQMVREMASCLQGLGRFVAYKRANGEVLLEAGPATRSLRVLFSDDETLAMYRLGSATDFNDVATVRLDNPIEVSQVRSVREAFLKGEEPSLDHHFLTI